MQHFLVERLKAEMALRSINMKELSLGSGLGATFVRDLVHGRSKNPRYDSIVKIAEFMECDPSLFFEAGQHQEADNGISDRLREARIKSGLTQSDLGRSVGVSPQAIQFLESGKSSGSKHIVAIAAAVGVNPTWLTTGHGEATNASSPRPLDRVIYRAMEDALPDTMGVAEVREVVTRQLGALRAAGVQLVAVGHPPNDSEDF